MPTKAQKTRGLIMPSDNVITRGKLKKQLLFFDQVILSDPSDRVLIADGALQHTSSDRSMTFWEAGRTPFPRHPDYEAVFHEVLAGTD